MEIMIDDRIIEPLHIHTRGAIEVGGCQSRGSQGTTTYKIPCITEVTVVDGSDDHSYLSAVVKNRMACEVRTHIFTRPGGF